jgi:hypothetical protein
LLQWCGEARTRITALRASFSFCSSFSALVGHRWPGGETTRRALSVFDALPDARAAAARERDIFQ